MTRLRQGRLPPIPAYRLYEATPVGEARLHYPARNLTTDPPPILPATNKREVHQLRNQKKHIKKTPSLLFRILLSHPTMILIEQTAVLTCLSHHSQHDDCNDGEEWVVVSQPKGSDVPLVQPLRPATSFDDCCSLAETSCSSDDELGPRRVSFSGDDEVHVVDRLYPTDSLSQHFYSCEDTQRYVSPLSLFHSFLFDGGEFFSLNFVRSVGWAGSVLVLVRCNNFQKHDFF